MPSIQNSGGRVRKGAHLLVLAAMALVLPVATPTPATAAPRVGSVAVAAQTGTLTAGTAGSVTYQVTVTNGDGKNVTAGLSVTAGLPAGSTAAFSPVSLPFSTAPAGTPMTSTLTITTNASTPAQTAVPFTVQAVRSNGGNGSDLATGNGTLTIGAAPGLTAQTITFGPLADKTVGDPSFTVSATASSGLIVTFAATGDCTIATNVVTITAAGSCTVTASQAGNGTYEPASDVQQSFNIANTGQTITFGPLANKTVGDLAFTVSATASSGLPVAFTAAGPCTVSGSTVAVPSAGTCTIFASQAGDASYAPAPDVQQTFVAVPTGGADATFNLYAVTGSAALPGQTVPVFGYNISTSTVTKPGGPELVVNQGDVVLVTLHNELSEASALLFGGQSMVPDTSGAAPGGTRSYLFTADNPGTYLYEAGLVPNTQHQVAMGLYGALVVRPPAGVAETGTSTGQDPSYSDTVVADGPANYYRLGEATGLIAVDEASAVNGTYGSAVTLAAPGLLANSANTAASFDGTANSFVDTGVTSLSGGPFSVEAWVNAASISGTGQRIVSKDEVGVTGAWILWLNGGKLRFQVRNLANTAWVIAEAPTTPAVGQTFHVVGVFDGTDAVLFVDGVEVARVALGSGTTNINSLPITIGADSDPTNPRDQVFDGTIDEVAIYSSALTSAQILAHHDAATQPVGMTLTDSSATFGAALVGGTLSNTTDGSSCPIAAVVSTTLTCSTPLSGGTANAWAAGDAYSATGPFTAYTDPASAYNDEAVLVLSEIDPALNNAANPAAFDMRKYDPRYFLINGEVYPNTAPISTTAGNDVLLRYVNAGIQYHSMALLGAHQRVIAFDGSPLNFSRRFVAETFGPGQTADAIVTVPAATVDGSKLAIYDGSLLLHNSNQGGFGGMLTFLDVSGTPGGGDTTGPLTSNIAFLAGTLIATVNDSTTGGSNIAAAEYYLDSTSGTATAMTATDGAFDSVNEGVTAPATISAGPHTLYVRGQDSAGNWGAFNSLLVNGGDDTGPITTGPRLIPNPSNGTTDVALHATANDTTTGGSTIAAAEYFIGAIDPGVGLATAMTVNNPATIASVDATITAATVDALTEGTHVVSIRSMDAAGNWGAVVTIDLLVDRIGPATVVVSANPNPNNGTLPFNPSTQAVRVKADLSDAGAGGSNIVAAEGFIDTVGATGTGFVFVASDGSFNSAVESGFADIPLTTIVQLSEGSHTIHVHSKDAAGNWGPFGTISFVIETDVPTVSGVILTPPSTDGTVPVAVNASATDASSAIAVAEWFAGADPGIGNGAAMTVAGSGPTYDLDGMINANGWAPGNYTISVRARDAAGNWSATGTAVLTVTPGPPATPTLLYFSTLDGGNANSVPGVPGPYDDADVYLWDSVATSFSRDLDGSAVGLPNNADIDGLALVGGLYYISFNRNGGTNYPNPGGGVFVAQDEDVVLYDPENGEWQPYFDGSECGLDGSNGRDIDAIDIVGGNLYFSTVGGGNANSVVGVPGPYDDADIYVWNGASCSRAFDASANGLPNSADVDGLTFVDADTFYFSFTGTVSTPGLGNVQDEDVVLSDAGVWSVYFDGTAQGLGTSNGQDLDAIDVQ